MTVPVSVLTQVGAIIQNPDLSAQVGLCLDDLDKFIGAAPGTIRGLVAQNLATAFTNARNTLANSKATVPLADLLPVAPQTVDVLSRCSGSPENERLGIWLQPALLGQLENVRVAKLPAIDLLGSNDWLAINLPLATVNLFIQTLWEQLTSQNNRLNGNGDPDPNGKIELRSWTLASPDSQTIVLTVNGTYHDSFANIPVGVDFSLTVTEVFSVMQFGGVSAVTSSVTNDISLDETLIKAVEAGAAFFSQYFGIPGIGLAFMTEAQIESVVNSALSSVTLPPFSIGKIVLGVLPAQVLIPGTSLKLPLSYDGVQAAMSPGGGGLTITGSSEPIPVQRQPGVLISGSTVVRVNRVQNPGPTVTIHYTLLSADMRAPLSVQWTAEGGVASPNATETDITFSLQHTPTTKKVSVFATDADGATSATSAVVSISTYSQAIPGPSNPIHRPKQLLPD